jgi:hypothetical protein
MKQRAIYKATYTTAPNADYTVANFSSGSFELRSGTSMPFSKDDVLKIKVVYNGVPRYAFILAGTQFYDGTNYRLPVNYDSQVYRDMIENATSIDGIIQYYAIDSFDEVLEMRTYSVNEEIEVSTFGKSYDVYNTKQTFTVSVPANKYRFLTELREFFLGTDDKVLVDFCDRKCYKVAPSNFESSPINGNLRTALTLNVSVK